MIVDVVSKENALTEATEELLRLLKQHASQPILFLSSGGSALQIIEDVIIPDEVQDITIGVLDERFEHDLSNNNFAGLMKTMFYESACEHDCKLLDSRVKKDEDFETFSMRFESGITSWCNNNPEGIIIVTQGMGPDGHTAGIMPFDNIQYFKETFDNPHKLVLGYDATKEKTSYPLRTTVTNSFLKYFVSYSLCLVLGDNKKIQVQNALGQDSKAHQVPFAIIRDMKDVKIYTDIKVA